MSDERERWQAASGRLEGGFSQQDYVAAYRGNADMRARMEEFHPAWGKAVLGSGSKGRGQRVSRRSVTMSEKSSSTVAQVPTWVIRPTP